MIGIYREVCTSITTNIFQIFQNTLTIPKNKPVSVHGVQKKIANTLTKFSVSGEITAYILDNPCNAFIDLK